MSSIKATFQKRLIKLPLVILATLPILIVPMPGLNMAGRAAAFLFLLTALLWITEAIPLYASSLLVIGLSIVLLAEPTGLLADKGVTYETIIQAAADPIILLFFGCFVLAAAAKKHNLDYGLTHYMLKPFATSPALLLAGVILITATFSMWMSNTATTAMMLAVLAPILNTMSNVHSFRKGLVLGTAFAANIGGIGTPIGTPPNAIALSLLREAGFPINFLGWMTLGVPLMVVLLIILWVFIYVFFDGRQASTKASDFPAKPELTWEGFVVAITFGVTVVLWLTATFHGISSSVVALLPIIVFTATSVMEPDDINSLSWDILILLAGALTLGSVMGLAELDQWIVGYIPVEWLGVVALTAFFVVIIILLSNFMSNTAAASLMIPIVVGIPGIPTVYTVVCVAFAASMAMALPVSTPPNTMAYGTGEIGTWDMFVPGLIISGISGAAIILFGYPVMTFWGFIP